MAAVRGVSLLLAIFSLISFAFSSEYVPIILWQTQNLGNDLPSVSAVGHTTNQELKSDIYPTIRNKQGPLLYFKQDTLSLEDFTIFGNVIGGKNNENSFSNIQKILETNPATMLPAAEVSKDNIASLSEGRETVVIDGNKYSPNDVDSLRNIDENSFVIVKLPKTSSVDERGKALKQNDKIVGDFTSRMKEKFKYFSAIYTGMKSSWIDGSDEERSRTSRHILGIEEGSSEGYIYIVNETAGVNQTCFMLYADNIKVTSGSGDSVGFNLTQFDVSSHDCGNSDANLTVQIALTQPQETSIALSITFVFNRIKYNDWNLDTVNVSFTNGSMPAVVCDVQDSFDGIWAPPYFSYHCTPESFSCTNDSNKFSLSLPNFQIQAFEFDGGKMAFGDPFDCIGFFTIAIWMAIFFCAILIIILGFGINAIMSINTMDRFDDPKGKTISVNVTD